MVFLFYYSLLALTYLYINLDSTVHAVNICLSVYQSLECTSGLKLVQKCFYIAE